MVDQLRLFAFGLGLGWVDVDILRAAGLRVITCSSYDGLSRCSARSGSMYFGVRWWKVLDEYRQRKDLLPDLCIKDIKDHLVLYYLLPMYFWFPSTQDGRRLAARAEEGMRTMIADGTYDRIFDRTRGARSNSST